MSIRDDKAVVEILELCRLHGLSYVQNPGGAEFNGPHGFRCQVDGDDADDLKKLKEALAKRYVTRLLAPVA